MEIPVDTRLVYRVVDTKPQKGLSESNRKNNLKNAFQKGESVVQYRCAIVVDDIYTTGVTAEAVAYELIKRGIRRVYFMAVCIGEEM
jgi:predicted amidophosphoribosyltransferase